MIDQLVERTLWIVAAALIAEIMLTILVMFAIDMIKHFYGGSEK